MQSVTRFSTALRPHVRTKIEQLGTAEIVIGIPSYHSADSIVHVIKTAIRGIERYYPGRKALVMVSDGGSTDDTRDVARTVDPKSFDIESIVTIYRGIPGKGSGLRAVFEVAAFLKARAVCVFDSDLLSITPEWIRNLLEPVFGGYDYVAPFYNRYKFDATITNTIAYNLNRTLYGRRIRQPIGGDFGLSPAMVKHYLNQDVWETDVAKFGIDIWMTTSAIVGGFKLCQARLGAKIHDHKDPSADLGPMFRQVVGTQFQLMAQYEDYWLNVRGSVEVPTLGEPIEQEAPAFEIDRNNLVAYFKMGWGNFGGVWKNIMTEEDYQIVEKLARKNKMNGFSMPLETWIRTVFRYAAAFNAAPRQRFKVLDTLIPLYYGRVASLVGELEALDPSQAERLIDGQAAVFESLKDDLIAVWQTRKERGA